MDTLTINRYLARAKTADFNRSQADFLIDELSDLVTKADLKFELAKLTSKLQTAQYRASWALLGALTTSISLFDALLHFMGT